MNIRKRTQFTFTDLDGDTHTVEINRLITDEYEFCFGASSDPTAEGFDEQVFALLAPTVDGVEMGPPGRNDWETEHAVVKGAIRHFLERLRSVLPKRAEQGADEQATTSPTPEAQPTA